MYTRLFCGVWSGSALFVNYLLDSLQTKMGKIIKGAPCENVSSVICGQRFFSVLIRPMIWVTPLTECCRLGMFYSYSYSSADILLNMIKLLFRQKFEVIFSFINLFAIYLLTSKCLRLIMRECRTFAVLALAGNYLLGIGVVIRLVVKGKRIVEVAAWQPPIKKDFGPFIGQCVNTTSVSYKMVHIELIYIKRVRSVHATSHQCLDVASSLMWRFFQRCMYAWYSLE